MEQQRTPPDPSPGRLVQHCRSHDQRRRWFLTQSWRTCAVLDTAAMHPGQGDSGTALPGSFWSRHPSNTLHTSWLTCLPAGSASTCAAGRLRPRTPARHRRTSWRCFGHRRQVHVIMTCGGRSCCTPAACCCWTATAPSLRTSPSQVHPLHACAVQGALSAVN